MFLTRQIDSECASSVRAKLHLYRNSFGELRKIIFGRIFDLHILNIQLPGEIIMYYR